MVVLQHLAITTAGAAAATPPMATAGPHPDREMATPVMEVPTLAALHPARDRAADQPAGENND